MKKILTLVGGVGGSKLVLGLSHILDPENLMIIVNTGDDEEIYGLYVSPDLDTVMYTLADVVNKKFGWGIGNDSFVTLNQLDKYGVDTWFKIGDIDFATHILRTEMIQSGMTLSEITKQLCSKFNIKHTVIPMTDGKVNTILETDKGFMEFQEYFVKNQFKPSVKSVSFKGIDDCVATPDFDAALNEYDNLIICPSNPFLSILPILSIPDVRSKIRNFNGTKIAVSPIIGNDSVKGPAGKMLKEQGHEVSALGVARLYSDICDIFVIDSSDKNLVSEIEDLGIEVHLSNIMMNTKEDKIALAKNLLSLLD